MKLPDPSESAHSTDAPASAVVLIIDQVSASMLGPYGNTLFETANFNRLAARSLLFDFAYADSPDLWTGYQRMWELQESSLPSELAQQGIESVLLSDETVVTEHELAGFDRIITLPPTPCQTAAGTPEETQLASFFAQATAILAELEPGGLCWLHSSGLRGAWDAPYSFRQMLADSEDPDPPTFLESPAMWLDPETADPDELLGLQQAAGAQLMLVDDFLGVLLDVLDASPLGQSTLFCLASPRGCALGEHGLVGPGAQLFNESVHVPLLICPPGQHSFAATRSGEFVQPHFLSELVYDWLTQPGNTSDRNTLAKKKFQKTLAAHARVLPDKRSDSIVISSNEHDSLQTHAWKLIRSKMGGVQLFAKPDDRFEVNDVSDRCPDIVSKLVLLLDLCLEQSPAERKFELPEELA